MPEFFELFWLVIRTCFTMQVLLWESYPLHMVAVTFGPALILLASMWLVYTYKIRQIEKRSKRDR